MIDISSDKTPIYVVVAGAVETPEALGMILYTNREKDKDRWTRRGLVDSIYIDPRAKLVSIGVDSRDIIDVDIDAEIMLMPKPVPA